MSWNVYLLRPGQDDLEWFLSGQPGTVQDAGEAAKNYSSNNNPHLTPKPGTIIMAVPHNGGPGGRAWRLEESGLYPL